jgi:hypothetical protein
MPMTPNDPLAGVTRGSAQQAIDWARGRGALGPFVAFIEELYRICPLIGLDAAILVAQASEETGVFTSGFWVDDGNSAGIGIPHGGVPSAFSVNDGALSARIQALIDLAHLGRTDVPDVVADALDVPGFAPLYRGSLSFATQDTGWPGVRTLLDLGIPFRSSLTGNQECTHACDDQYAVNISDHGNAMFSDFSPVEPVATVDGIDRAWKEKRFGEKTVTRFIDGQKETFRIAYNPAGAISQLWDARGAATGSWPKFSTYQQFERAREFWHFEDGWTVWRPNSREQPRVLQAEP